MVRTAESVIKHVNSAVTQARIAMNSAKLSMTNPPFHTVIATPESTWRSPRSTRPHAASEATSPMHAIQRWMSGRSFGLITATSAETRAVPMSSNSGSRASVSACVKSAGTRSASRDPCCDLEDPVGDHWYNRSCAQPEQHRSGDEWNQHSQVEQRDVANSHELVANRSEEHPIRHPEQAARGDDDARHDKDGRDAMLGKGAGEHHEVAGEPRKHRDADDARRGDEPEPGKPRCLRDKPAHRSDARGPGPL